MDKGPGTRDGRQIPLVAVWLLVVAFAVTFATLSLRRHAALATNGMDLGNVNQALWNTAQGDFLAFTNMAPIRSRLALHVEPILLLLVPFYWVGLGGPELLLVVQAIIVGLGALPLYWLAREALIGSGEYEVGSRQVGNAESLLSTPYFLLPVIFPLAYLLLPALEAAVMYDFHAVTLAPTFLLCALLYVERDRPWLFAIFIALALACKEDMGLTVAMLGLYVMVARRRWRWGMAMALVGLAWFAVAVFLVQPGFSPNGGNIQAERYAWLGQTPLDVLVTLLRRPGIVWDHVWRQANLPGYLAGLLLPTAFVSVLAPLAWLPALPSLAINLLSNNAFTWRLEDFHYAAPIAPFVVIASVYGVKRLTGWAGGLGSRRGEYVLVGMSVLLLVTALAYHQARGFSPLAGLFGPGRGGPFQSWPITEHQRHAEAVFAQVPPAAALFAQSNLNPHVSSRHVLYQEPALLSQPELRGGLPAPDYLLFDVASLVNQNDFHRFIASELLDDGQFGAVLAKDGFLLLKRGLDAGPLADEFFDFARATSEAITYPLVADFGDMLRLHGFDLLFSRSEEAQVVVYLEALRQLDEDYFLSLYLLDRWGTPLGATVEDQPAMVWYPPRRWRSGELVKVTFNTLTWYTRDLPAYRLAFGVMRGRDPWQPAARLSPSVRPESNPAYAVRLPENGTLLELARLRQMATFGLLDGMPTGGPVEREFWRPRPRTAVDISLGGEVRLLGYDMALTGCRADGLPAPHDGTAGCWLELLLYWQAQKAIIHDYTVFVHVLGPDSRMWGQRDAPPDSGAYPTRRWEDGEVVVDPVRIPLPADLPATTLDVVVGMYYPGTGQRLPILDASGQSVDDKVVLETIKLQ